MGWVRCSAFDPIPTHPAQTQPESTPVVECSPTRRSGLPGTERFISPARRQFLWHSNNRTVRTVLFSYRLSCRAVPRGTGPALGAAYFLLRRPRTRLGLLPRGQSQPSCTRRAPRADSCRVAVGRGCRSTGFEPTAKTLQRIAKDSKHKAQCF